MRSSIRKPIVNTYGSLYRQYLSALKPPLFYKSLLAAVAIIFSVPVDSRAEVNEVEAVQHGRSLFIFGDENNNAIQIGQFDTGDIVVQGIECDGRVTEVNGGDELAVFSNVQNIFVKLGDGDDCVAASNELSLLSDCLNLGKGYFGESESSVDLGESIFISGELEIVTGQGNDEVYIGGFETGRAMEVYTQSGNDRVGFCDIYVGTNLLVYTSSGEDQIGIVGFEDFVPESFDGPMNYVRYKTLINSGHDNDEVCVESLFIDEGQLKVLTYSGNDDVFIGSCNRSADPEDGHEGGGYGIVDVGTNVVLDTGNGNDVTAIVNTLVGTSLVAVLGNGYNDLSIQYVSVGRSTIIETGDQDDDVWINDFETENDLVLRMRQGNDEAGVNNSLVGGNLIATLGIGSDDLYLDNLGVGRMTFVNTDSGDDGIFADLVDSDRMQFIMGNGDDELWIRYSSGFNLYANGGSGTDCFYDFDNDIAAENVRSFELQCDD